MEKAENGVACFPLSHNLGLRLRWKRVEGAVSGAQEALAGLSGLGVEADQQLVGECDADYLWGLACKSLSEGDEVGFVAGGDAGDDEEDLADGGSSSADSSPALMFAAVLSQGREACELGDGFVGEGADLRHFSHDAGYGAVGDACP